MRKTLLRLLMFLGMVVLWYGFWRFMMVEDVARVKALIAYQNQQFKTISRTIVFKAESVEPSGFPFDFHVRVVRPTLSMIDGKETFAISIPAVNLEPEDRAQGRYRVVLPGHFDALYATDGAAPENYSLTLSEVPKLILRAQGDSQQCSGFPGAPRCADVKADAPFISYAAQLPKTLTLHMELNGENRDAKFDFVTLGIPVFQTIPTDMTRPLQIFVGMLREALVFKTK